MKKAVLATTLLLAVSGCFSHVVTNPSPMGELIPVNEENLNAPYQIGVGDKLEIKFFSTPDLNTEVQVRPDGRISMMFADDIRAAGLTPEQLARKLKEKLQKHLKKPDMVVAVKGFGSQRVYVGGEVLIRGRYNCRGVTALFRC